MSFKSITRIIFANSIYGFQVSLADLLRQLKNILFKIQDSNIFDFILSECLKMNVFENDLILD